MHKTGCKDTNSFWNFNKTLKKRLNLLEIFLEKGVFLMKILLEGHLFCNTTKYYFANKKLYVKFFWIDIKPFLSLFIVICISPFPALI